MQGLYNDVKLTRFLEDQDVRAVLSQLDVDRVLGFVTDTRQPAPAGMNTFPKPRRLRNKQIVSPC